MHEPYTQDSAACRPSMHTCDCYQQGRNAVEAWSLEGATALLGEAVA